MPKRKSMAQVEDDENAASVMEYLSKIPDPRMQRARFYSLTDILMLSLCAIICGANDFVAIEEFGQVKEEWLTTFLDLPNGIPSNDTIGRVFAMLNPKTLEAMFRAWMRGVAELTSGEVVAIDGKTLRRSFRKAGSGIFVHMISAWATRNSVVLGQVKTEEKSNEITAIPELLGLLSVKGCIVTIDAMGCRKDIAANIVDAGADYCLAVKDNQPTLRADIVEAFQSTREEPAKLAAMNYAETKDKGHGRTESRRCWTVDVADHISQANQWKTCASSRWSRSSAPSEGRRPTNSATPSALAPTSLRSRRWTRSGRTGVSKTNSTGCSMLRFEKTTAASEPATRPKATRCFVTSR